MAETSAATSAADEPRPVLCASSSLTPKSAKRVPLLAPGACEVAVWE